MEKVFMTKGVTTPEEYLKNMLDCIDENGELYISREMDEFTFCTAESEEESSHVEKVKVDVKFVDYSVLYGFYNQVLNGLKDGTFWDEYPASAEIGKYGDRMVTFVKRIEKLMEWDAPAFIIQIEKCMLIDSIVLYKANAVGDMSEREK